MQRTKAGGWRDVNILCLNAWVEKGRKRGIHTGKGIESRDGKLHVDELEILTEPIEGDARVGGDKERHGGAAMIKSVSARPNTSLT